MALVQCDYFSDVLGMSVSMNVILPQSTVSQVGMEGRAGAGEFPCLYLLHGWSDDHTIWQRRTSIERYVAELGLAVVMPNVHKSYYANMAKGLKYWTFVSEELPQIARSMFRLSARREDNFVAGLSMGGYGALKIGMRCPDQYCAAASMSGAVDVQRLAQETEGVRGDELALIFGDAGEPVPEDDLFDLVKNASGRDDLPALWQCCGTDDYLYDDNIRFRNSAKDAGLSLHYEEGPGDHNWAYWDQQIQRVLEWLPLAST